MKKLIVVLDFDGVLVDSYSGLVSVYVKVLNKHPDIGGSSLEHVERLARELVELEDYYDSIRKYDRRILLQEFLSAKGYIVNENLVEDLLRIYWKKRIEYSRVFPDAKTLLDKLYGKYTLILLTDYDGEPGLKMHRIKASQLHEYFDEIVVVGEPGNPTTKRKGLLYIMEKYRVKPRRIIFVDDKPRVIASVEDIGVITVLRKFKPPLMRLAWMGEARPKYTLSSLEKLYEEICLHLGKNNHLNNEF